MALISTVGGASGPLYGTAFLRAAKAAQGKDPLRPEDAAQIFRAAVDGVKERGKAVRGDKTMVDSLEPACDAFQKAADSGKPLADCLDAAVDSAGAGVEYTKTITAKKGAPAISESAVSGTRTPAPHRC